MIRQARRLRGATRMRPRCKAALLVLALLAAPLHALAEQVRASALLGAAVDEPGGKNIGYVTDLAIDLESGEVRYAMVQANANAGIDQRVYGVSLAALRPAAMRDRLVLDRAAARALPPAAPDVQLVRVSRLIGGDVADLVVELRTGEVAHAIVRSPDGATRAAPLHVLDPAIELKGTIIDRGRVATRDGVRQTAKLRTPEGRVLELDLGAPGGEATIAAGESVVLAAHPGELDGRRVLVVDVILQRLEK